MTDASVSSNVSQHKHMVLTGYKILPVDNPVLKKETGKRLWVPAGGRKDLFGEKGLYIQVCDQIKPSDFTCSRYLLLHQGAQQYIMSETRKAPSPKLVLQELGWFSDSTIFGSIIENVPIPTLAVTAQQDNNEYEDKVFCAWINDVLRELARPQHANNWQRNDGNSI